MPNFEVDKTYLPITMQQFEDLTNEILLEINKLVVDKNSQSEPQFFNADYLAQVLMSSIHAYDHKHGLVSKTELFDSCVNRISCHVTFHIVQEIQAKLKSKDGKKPTLVPGADDLTDEPSGI